jgi:hypothetical protein
MEWWGGDGVPKWKMLGFVNMKESSDFQLGPLINELDLKRCGHSIPYSR